MLTRYIFRITFLCMLSHALYAQKDNIEKLFQNAQKLSDEDKDAEACVVYRQLEASYKKLSANQQQELWENWAYSLIAQDKNDSAAVISKRILAHPKALPQYMYSHYDQMGHIYKARAVLDTAMSNFKKSEEINNTHQLKKIGHLTGFAQVYIHKGDYTNALKYFFDAYQISLKNKNQVDLVNTIVEIGMVYLYTGKYKEAISEYQKAITIQEQHHINKYLAVCFHRMGIAYSGLRRFKEAIFYYKRAAKRYTQTGNLYTLPYTYVSLGQAYQFLGDYKTAKTYLKLSEETVEKLGGTINLVETYKTTSSIYYNMEMYEQAEQAAQKALKLAENHGMAYEKKQLTYILSRLYHDKKDYSKAHQYLSEYQIVTDSLLNSEKEHISQDLFKKYEIAEKERVLVEKELALTQQTYNTQWWLLAAFSTLIAVLILGVLVFYNKTRYQQKLNTSFDLITEKVQSLRQQMETGQPISLETYQKKASKRLNYAVEQIVTFEQEMFAKLQTSTSFNALVSHELRQELKQIQESLNAFEKETEMDKKVALSDSIERVAQLDVLVKDLLKIAELEQKPLYTTAFSLSDLVEEVKDELKIPLGLRIQTSDLPVIEADMFLMKQVLLNLLRNAIKSSSNNTNTTIKVLATLGEEIQVRIVDKGLGFDPELSPLLFQSFRKLHANIEGMGLIIVREIVQKHDGRVFAYNNVGGGATFGFALPNTRLIPPKESNYLIGKSPST